MKQTKTTLKELTAMYRAVLRHGILCNAIALGLIAATPAMADNSPNTSAVNPAWVFGDITLADAPVGMATIGGRRINSWDGTKYQNDIPQYHMVGQSLSVTNSDMYVGPVSLELREIDAANDTFAYNYQWDTDGDEINNDVDLANWAGVGWNEEYTNAGQTGVYDKVAAKINSTEPGAYDNAGDTAPGVYMFSRLDTEHTNAGAMSFSGSTVTTNGTTVNADSISVTDGSTITVVNEDTLSLTAFNGGNIDTTGVTTLNADTINIDGSRMIVDAGASLTINPTTSATFANNSATDGGAVYNAGTLTVSDATFNNNSATGNSGAIAGAAGSTLTLNNVAFSKNSADWGGAMVARGTTNITGGSFTENSSNDGGGAIYLATLINKGHKLNINGTKFTGNSTAGVDLDGGGAIGSFSDLTLKNATFTGNHVDGTASNGGGALFLGSVSTNDIDNTTFISNTSATNGGAISMRFVDQGNNAAATLDITNASFASNSAADGKGGAIYNTFHNDKAGDGYASVSGSTFAGNSAYKGGAIYNEGAGTTDTVGGVMTLTDSTFTGNSATERGGALFNYGELTIDGVVFTSNSTTSESYPSQGGAIYNAGDVDYLDNYGVLTISNTTFGDANDSTKGNIAMQGGAISNDSNNSYNAELTLNNTNFYYNKAQSDADGGYSALGGAIHNLSNADMTINGNTTFKGNSAEGYSAEGGAIYNSNWEKLTFNNAVTFDSNTVKDTSGDNGGLGGAISHHNGEMIFKDAAIFTNNKSISADIGGEQPSGGAIYNDDGTITFEKGATFTENEAMYGGAVFNYDGTVTINDGTFTDNKAGDEGGAIFNLYGATNINAVNNNVVFSGNKGAYGTSGEYANDITNYAGTINLNAASGKTITLAGGIDGVSGELNINGAGTVETSTIKNHTVALNGGELHLTNADLTGSTVNVASGATINTIDDLINDYSANITLDSGALIKGDIDFLAGTADKYAATDGATVKYKVGNLISDIGKGTKDIQVVSDGAKVDISEATWTSTNGAAFVSSDAFDGMMKVRGFEGGITEAAGATAGATGDGSDGVKETEYQLTENETVGTASSFYNNVKLTGDGVEDGDKSVTLDADLTAEENANVEISELKLAGTGKYVNNALTRIKNSRIDVNVDNYGTWESDPTTYSGTVNNYADSIASFDEDTFESTATLANAGNAILMRGVTFDSGAAITGSGTTTLAAGLTHFNDTANGNTVAVARGALFDGTIVNSGTVDTRNGGIDAGLGTVTGGDVYVDADYVANKIDMFATGRAVNKINLINSEYGDAASKVLDLGGNTLASGATFSGGYYTKMTDNGTSVTFSDKLMNTSGMHAQLGNWSAANFIGDSTEYVAATDSYSTTQGQTVGQALTALDTAIGDMSGFGSQNYAKNTTNVAANLTALDTQLKTVSTAGTIASGQTGFVTGDAANTALNAKQNTLTAGSNITISGDTISATDTTYTAGTGLALTGTTFSIADGGVGTTQLADNAVTTDKLSSGVQTSLGKADSAIQSVKVNGTALTPDAAKAVDITAVTGIKIGTGAAQSGEVTLGTTAATNLADNIGIAAPTDAEIATWAGTNAANVATVGTTFDVLSKKLVNVQSDLMADGDNASSIARALGAVDGEHTTLIAQVNSMADARIAASTVDAADLHTAIATIDGSSAAAKDKRNALGALLTTGANAGKTLTAASTAEAVAEYMKLSADVMSEYDFGWDLNTGLPNDLVAGKMKIDVLNDSSVTDKTVAGAINANTAAIANIATTATAAYDQAHDWAESLLGVDVDTGVSHQLQDALTSNDVIGAANNFADALSALDAQTYANKNNIGTLTGLTTTDKSNLVAAVNEVVGDITVGAGTYNYISAGANVAGNLTALDTGLKAAADKNSVQDTGLANLAARLGVTYTAADGSVSATDYTSNNYVTDGDSVVTAVSALDTAIATAATTVTAAYNQAHAWAEGLLGVDVDEGTDNQLQNALTGLGGTTTIAGGTTTIVGALKDLDTGIENLTTDTTTGAINVASANIGAGGLAVAGDTALTGDLTVGGDTTLTGLLTANGGINTTTLTTTGDTSVGGNLAVTGTTTLTGLLTANGGISTTTLTTTGDATVGGDLAVTGALNGSTATFTGAVSADSVAATNGVSAKTLSATDSITLGSNTITSIDTAGLARGVAGGTGVLATTASVTTTIANQAQDATYTNTITTGSNVTGTTLNTAIANLDSVIGNMASLSARDDANSVGNALANGGTTTPTTVVAALNNIDATLGTVHNLSGKLTTAGTYKGNLASGTTTTVEDHLVAVDTAIGDRSSLASLNTAINAAAATDVATALETTGNLIGDMNFAGTNYLATVTDMSEAVRVLDSNITKIDHKVEKLERKVNSGMASMAALTALVPNARDCGDTQVSVGTGVYADRAGIAMGAFHYFNDHVLFNAGASYGGTRDWAFRAGITFGL